LTEDVPFWWKFTVKSFEFLLLICKLNRILALGTKLESSKNTNSK
jgi:hypothetical protein